jgi:hypothetical protein
MLLQNPLQHGLRRGPVQVHVDIERIGEPPGDNVGHVTGHRGVEVERVFLLGQLDELVPPLLAGHPTDLGVELLGGGLSSLAGLVTPGGRRAAAAGRGQGQCEAGRERGRQPPASERFAVHLISCPARSVSA